MPAIINESYAKAEKEYLELFMDARLELAKMGELHPLDTVVRQMMDRIAKDLHLPQQSMD